MLDDPRCCGSGTCIIDAEGMCWCGQRWEGDRLVGPGSACAPCAAPTAHAAMPADDAPAEAARAPTHPTQR